MTMTPFSRERGEGTLLPDGHCSKNLLACFRVIDTRKIFDQAYIVGKPSPELEGSINIHRSLSERVAKTTSIEKKTMDIEERGVRLRLTIVDTPGKKYRRIFLFFI